MERVSGYLKEHAVRFVDELTEFLRIPSVSGDSQFADSMKQAAAFASARLVDAGVDARVIETAGHPMVYGEKIESPDLPTVLVYGHYDVQPPDPLEEWDSPPFEPTVRDGRIYARGATDDKGQLYTHIKSVEAWIRTEGRLPVNVKFIIEGEEEIGSPNLNVFLRSNQELLSADVAVISDTSQFAPGQPAITNGLRGLLSCEVRLSGPNQDLHSGSFGGAVANPVNALAKLVASLVDDNGRVCIPGFYDEVIPLSEQERARLAALPFDEAEYLARLGMDATFGEAGYSTLERCWTRPTCDVNGLYGGYQGEGPKTIIPATATAKITCRLVPGQNPQRLIHSLEQYLREQVRPGLQFEFSSRGACPGLAFDSEGKWMDAAVRSIEAAFGTKPVFTRCGGSIPVVLSLQEILGLETLLLGWGQETDNLHSPNEHFTLADYHRGMLASAHLWNQIAAAQ